MEQYYLRCWSCKEDTEAVDEDTFWKKAVGGSVVYPRIVEPTESCDKCLEDARRALKAEQQKFVHPPFP